MSGLKLINTLHRANQLAADEWAKAAHEAGECSLTPRQAAVLDAIAAANKPSQTQVVELTGIDRSTLADITRRLVKRGFLARKRTKDDARTYALTVTADGHRELAASVAISDKVNKALIENVTGVLKLAIGSKAGAASKVAA